MRLFTGLTSVPMLVMIMVILMGLSTGCSGPKAEQNQSDSNMKEIGSVQIPIEPGSSPGGSSDDSTGGAAGTQIPLNKAGEIDVNELRKRQQTYTVGPFEMTIGGYDEQAQSTPLEIRNTSGTTIAKLVLQVASVNGKASLTTSDNTILVGKDKKTAQIGSLGIKKGRILFVTGAPKEQIELSAVYGKGETVKLFPQPVSR